MDELAHAPTTAPETPFGPALPRCTPLGLQREKTPDNRQGRRDRHARWDGRRECYRVVPLGKTPLPCRALPGDYRVEISKSVMGDKKPGASDDEPITINLRNELPMQYASIASSGLKVTVPDTGTDQIKFELTSK